MKKQHQLNLRMIWRLYQILGKDKLEKEGVMARLSTVSKEEFIEMIHLVDSKGKNPMEKQASWTVEMLSVGLEEFAKIIREMFNAD